MKPIKLVIKGLNSFIEEQTIDFNKLTDRGLFGIFGPTGSGKSTILDGITLALYGDIARKSSNYINTNCNDLNVSFTFQISGSPNHVYVVSRHFKRDKKTGNAKTHSAMVKEITDGKEEILAESVTTVNKTCKEILGLSLEDFTRTVVLPQGKFSEFLKLEGKQRRDMLERLFNLQDYGERLSTRLSKQKNTQSDELNKILGEMNSYEDISEEKLVEEKKKLVNTENELKEVKKQKDEVDLRYKKGEEIWKMQNELAGYKERQKQLESQAEEIEAQTQRVNQGESAAKVYPFLQNYEKTQEELQKFKAEHISLESKQKELTIKKETIQQAYEKANQEKEKHLPQLKDKNAQLQEAMSELDKLIGIDEYIGQVQDGLKRVVNDINNRELEEMKLTAQIEEINKEIQQNQEVEKTFKVEELIRTQVQEGLKLTEICALDKKSLDKNAQDREHMLEAKKALEETHRSLRQAVEAKIEEVARQLEIQKKHVEEAPITREALDEKQQQLAITKEKYVRLQKLRADIESHENELKAIALQKEGLVVTFEAKKKSFEDAQLELERAKMENLAHFLRAQLQEGKRCPVCGSTTHHLDNVEEINDMDLSTLEEKVKELETAYKEAETYLNKLQVNEIAQQAQLNRLQEEGTPLEALFKECSMDKQEQLVNELKEALTNYEAQKESIEKGILQLKEEQLKLEAEAGKSLIQLEENKKQIEKLTKDIEEQQERFNSNKESLEQLKSQVGTQDFEAIAHEILDKDRKREAIAKEISEKTQKKEELIKNREGVKEYLNRRKLKLGTGMTTFDENQKNKQELIGNIGERLQTILKLEEGTRLEITQSINEAVAFIKEQPLLGDILKGKISYETSVMTSSNSLDSESELKITVEALEQWFGEYPVLGECLSKLGNYFGSLQVVINKAVSSIEMQFAEVSKEKEEVTNQYEHISTLLVESTTNCEAYTKRLRSEKENLEQQLREENLTEAEVKRYLLAKEELEALKQMINNYQDEKTKLLGSIEAVQGKLGNDRLEEAEWNKLQEERRQILELIEKITKDHINQTTEVNRIESALAKLGELREKKQKIDHQIAILSDLDKLFKGKRFVEFVAITRLKYISLEASKQLREITNGIYGLEVDDDGRFIIRDYKNGGAQRDASTLSGGETFLASLALALALSAEIQLKGTAPLELFFLDEGFGTLDDDLLEVVMSALEKIHHDKLKVGIISHVEAIKNRVPVKLMLTPAEAGKGGTKVKLEHS